LAQILSRYLLREVVVAWLAVTAVLLVILLTNQLAAVLARAAEGGFPRAVVLELVGLGVMRNLAVLLPVGLLLGVMLALGRLYHDSEMTAVVACGVEPRRIYGPIVLLAVLVAALVAWLSLRAGPEAAAGVQALRSSALQAGEFSPITPGRFRSFGGGSAVFYAESAAPDGSLRGIFVKRRSGDTYEIAVADRARHEISPDRTLHTLTLLDGERYEGRPGSAEFRRVRFEENVIPVRVPQGTPGKSDIESMPTTALLGREDLGARAELAWRIALPVMVFVLAVLAVPMARLRPRQGRHARLWLAIGVYFVYFSLASAARVWLGKGAAPPALGLWWVHALVILLTFSVLWGPARLSRWRHRERLAPA
jgi:lipopolysaccharide export system permease protein